MRSPNLETTALTLYLVQYAFIKLLIRCLCFPLERDDLITSVTYAALQSIGAQPLPFHSFFPANILVSDLVFFTNLLAQPLEEAGVDVRRRLPYVRNASM